MDESPLFLILGETNDEKGKNFEQFIKTFLKTIGYSDIRSIRRTGMQIDFTATHFFSRTRCIGEAKGYKKGKNVQSEPVLAFAKKIDIYKDDENLTDCKGYVITTSGFSWEIDDLKRKSEVLKNVTLINGEDLVKLLKDSEFIPSTDLLNSNIQEQLPFTMEDKSILIYNGTLFWLCKFKRESGESKYYAIFDRKGKYIKHYEVRTIIELLPEETRERSMVDLDLRFKILEYFLDEEVSSIEEISLKLEISKESIELNLDFLNSQEKIVTTVNKNTFRLSREIEHFRHLYNIIYKSRERDLLLKLYLSDYFEKIIDQRMIKYILNRFYIFEPSDLQKEELTKVISLFPSTLTHCLNEKTTLFKNTFNSRNQFKGININDILYKDLKYQLFWAIMEDISKNSSVTTAIKSKGNLLEERIIGNYKVLKNQELYLDFKSEATVFLRKYVGTESIEAGMPLSATSIQGSLQTDALLIELGDYERAIRNFQESAENPNLQQFRNQILINLGVALAHNQQFSEAIEVYTDALSYNQHIPLILNNLIRAWYLRARQAINLQNQIPLNQIYVVNCLLEAKRYFDKFNLLTLNEDDKQKFMGLNAVNKDIEDLLNVFYEKGLEILPIYQIPDFLFQIKNIDEDLVKKIFEKNKDIFALILNKDYYELRPHSWNMLANIYIKLGENKHALILIDKALQHFEKKHDIFNFMDTKAEILYNLGKFEESFDVFSKILEVDKDDPRVKLFYAETCWKASKTALKLRRNEKFKELRTIAKELAETHCCIKKIQNQIKKE